MINEGSSNEACDDDVLLLISLIYRTNVIMIGLFHFDMVYLLDKYHCIAFNLLHTFCFEYALIFRFICSITVQTYPFSFNLSFLHK